MEKYAINIEDDFIKQDIGINEINLDNVNSLTGIYKFDILASDILDCRIFLFGDMHVATKKGFVGQNNESLYLPIYLDALFKKYPEKQFDFMFEVRLDRNKTFPGINNPSVIKNTFIQFNNCYVDINDKMECNKEYPNVRFHSTDIRHIGPEYAGNNPFLEKVILLSKINYMLGDLIMELETDKSETKIDEIYNLIKQKSVILFDSYKNGKGEYFINQMKSSNKYQRYKKLNNIEATNIFIKNCINYEFATTDIFDNMEKLQARDFITYYELQSLMIKMKNFVFHVWTYLTDYYTFIRFMKTLSYGGKNIIMLGGYFHTENAKNFIRTIDPTSYFIYGKQEVEDNIFNSVQDLISEINYKQISIPTSIRLTKLLEVTKKILQFLTQNKNIYDPKYTKITYNLLSILENQEYIRKNKERICELEPHKRILQISSTIIENSLL